jgi:hypothetical protein
VKTAGTEELYYGCIPCHQLEVSKWLLGRGNAAKDALPKGRDQVHHTCRSKNPALILKNYFRILQKRRKDCNLYITTRCAQSII